jgi:endonuclease YncB( thermonuclease family)
MKILHLLATALLLASPSFAQVVDGDTIKLAGMTYPLWGIDAPEGKQACANGWPAGLEAHQALAALLNNKTVVCEAKTRDRYGRTVALCRADGMDVQAAMVRSGMAWAFTQYSADYVREEAEAKSERLGIHAHACQPAWEWRAERK